MDDDDHEGREWLVWAGQSAPAKFEVMGRMAVGDVLADDARVSKLEVRWPMPGREASWTVVPTLRPTAEGLRITGLRIEPTSPGYDEGLSDYLLAALRLGPLRAAIQGDLGQLSAILPSAFVSMVHAPRPGNKARPELFYARVAAEFVEALNVAPDRPIAHLVEKDPKVPAWKWRARTKTAMDRGMLTNRPPGNAGRAGGELTPKAIELLAKGGRQWPV